MLLKLSEKEIRSLPLAPDLLAKPHGTLVVWQSFDRLAAAEPSLERALGGRMDVARDHLSLVFHRFLHPSSGTRPVAMSINCNPLDAVDPFLTTHRATQALPIEDFMVERERVVVEARFYPTISQS